MKKSLRFSLTVLMLLWAAGLNAADSGWYFYVWNNSTSSGGDWGQFQTTSTPNVFVIEGMEVSVAGINFCVRSSDWNAKYGWSSAGVTSTGVDVQLASANGATGWLNLPVGTYDVTFNLTNLTIRFDEPAEEPTSSLVYVDNGGVIRWTADDSELRLFGVNYGLPSACHYRAAGYVGHSTLAQKKAMIDEDLDHLQRLGFDAIRLAFYGDYENTSSTGVLQDNDHLDLLCYLIDQATRRNIYMLLTPIIGYDSRWPENTYSSTVDSNGTGMARSFSSQDDKWAYLYTNEAAYTYANTYISQLLEYQNSYTGYKIKNEPNILFIEVLNEPSYSETLLDWKAEATTKFRAAINGYVSTIRATECGKPIFFNVSQDMHASDIVDGSNVDGGTYAWYPFSVDNRYVQRGNGLLWTDRYEQLLDDTDYPFSKGRIVYEFDSADRNDAFTLPAMMRELRRGGIQFAAMYDYDMLRTAPYNNCTRSHYFNLVYTPHKAVSAMIAAEVMRTQAAGTANGYYPANNVFGNVRVSYNDSVAVLNDGVHFYYSNNTTDVPTTPAALAHIVGCGTSPVVDYTGSGIYFLDKTGDDTWTLEVYPDITPLSDPFKGFGALTDITSPAVVTKSACNEQNIYINLPSLQNSFKVTPGRYVITDGVITSSEALAADSFYDSFSALSEPSTAMGENTATTVTLVNVNNDNSSDQLWSRMRYSRTFHSPETTVATSWDNSTSKNYLTCTVSSLAESTDYTNYGNYPDATISFYVGDRMTNVFIPTSFTVNAKGLNSRTNKALFLVVDCDGNAWGKSITLSTSSYTSTTVNVSDLVPYKAAMLPQDWPGVNSYWFPASESNTATYSSIDWSKVDRVQLSLRKDLYSSNLSSARSMGLNYITMTGTRSLTLDENATSPIRYPGSTYNLIINRSLEAGKWSAICLPLWMSQETVEWYFGPGTVLAQFDSFSAGRIVGGVKQPDELHFKTVTETNGTYLEANKPYLIKPTTGTVGGAQPVRGLHRAAPTPITIDNQWVAPFEPQPVTDENYTFVGAAAVRAASPSTYTVGDDGTFLSDDTPAGDTTIKATEAYVIADAETPVEEDGLVVVVDDVVTAVEGLHVVRAVNDGRVYDLAGRCMGDTLQGLPAGLYFVNGRKVLVK